MPSDSSVAGSTYLRANMGCHDAVHAYVCNASRDWGHATQVAAPRSIRVFDTDPSVVTYYQGLPVCEPGGCGRPQNDGAIGSLDAQGRFTRSCLIHPLLPGIYRLDAEPVSAGGETYDPVPTSISAALYAGAHWNQDQKTVITYRKR